MERPEYSDDKYYPTTIPEHEELYISLGGK